ncbi:MAG: tetratricopeptide repeat protein [Bacteroidota bacterium]
MKRKTDSLLTVLKRIPEHSSKSNDSLRLNTIFYVISRTSDDTLQHYLKYAFNQCNAYSQIVSGIDSKSKTEVQEAIRKDIFVRYYLKMKSLLITKSGTLKANSDGKLQAFLLALRISEKIDDHVGQAVAHSNIAEVYLKQSDFNKAIDNLLISQNIYRHIKDKKLLAGSYLDLGEIYVKQKVFDKALQNFETSLNLAKEASDIIKMSINYERIGNCYIDMGNYSKAIENHFASLQISEQLNDTKGVADSYGDIASIYYRMGDFPKCKANWLAALNKYKEFGQPYLIANGYRDVAEANYWLREFDQALLNLDSALRIYKSEKELHDEAIVYSLMSDAYGEKHDFRNTVNYLKKAVDINKKYNFIEELAKAYKTLSDIYVKRNDFKEAYLYHLQFSDMKDSLAKYGDETVGNITEMQSKFDKEKIAQEKLLHEAVLAQKESKLEQEKTQRYALYGGLILLIAFSVFVFHRFRITQRQKVIIEQQKQMVDNAFKTLEDKNREVMSSITYAQRIQRALITSEMYIEKQLNRLAKNDASDNS